ncbi:MAG: fused MFS/spermidine synthase [Burkholderiales bacterium]|nr:fused MFS/spermidine synthase [Burkholderiales bacterium]
MASTHRLRIACLYSIFFVSGFCGLIYESIWSHYLKLMLGHAAYAQTVVLVVFVGGLAIGAWLTGKWSERIRRPLLAYAAAEAAVAAASFAFHGIFLEVSDWAAADFLPSYCAAQGPCHALWLLAAALILPGSILLGTTFPLMSAGVLRLGVNPGRGLGLLYFLNSAGASLGVLCSGFVLIPTLGLPGTLLVAAGANAAVALAAYAAGQGAGSRPVAPAASAPQAAAGSPLLRPLLAVALFTGFSSFIYEVVWVRMLTLVLGAATHSFELMLAPFIMGLALGAWWIRDRIDTSARPERLLAKVQVVMGLLAVITLPLYLESFQAMSFSLRALARGDEAYILFNVASGLLAAGVMMPAAFCAGMTLPLITARLLQAGLGERQVGRVYGINTLGAICGVLVTVHLLIPGVGLKWSLCLAALVDVALGAFLFYRFRQRREPPGRWYWPPAGVWAGLAACAVLAVPAFTAMDQRLLSSGVFRTARAEIPAANDVVFHRDGKTATITVLEKKQTGERVLLTNGKPDGATHPARSSVTPDDHTVVLLGALGPLHHPQARRAAVIGLGTGVTSSVLLESAALEHVDTIEIEPAIVEAAQWFRPASAKVFDDPRSHLVIDDARAHFARTRARYDIIVSEPSNPWVSGVSGLFTQEFYGHVARHLAPDGHFVQWLQVYEASPEMVSSVIRAFSSVFPKFRAYMTNDLDVVLVARNDLRPATVADGVLEGMPGMRATLQHIGITSTSLLAAHDAGRGSAIQLLADSYGAPPNSDFTPFVDRLAARDRFQRRTASDLFQLRLAPVPVLELAGNAPAHLDTIHTASPYMARKVKDIASAWQGRRYLQGENLSPAEMGYWGTLSRDYGLVREWIAGCRFPRQDDANWTALLRVASELNPGLSPASAGAFWKGIGARCGKQLSPGTTAWLDLFAAVGARRPAAIRKSADALLAGQQVLSPEEGDYLLLAGASARLAQGHNREARDFLEHHDKTGSASHNALPWFRHLGLMLTLQQKKPAVEPPPVKP